MTLRSGPIEPTSIVEPNEVSTTKVPRGNLRSSMEKSFAGTSRFTASQLNDNS